MKSKKGKQLRSKNKKDRIDQVVETILGISIGFPKLQTLGELQQASVTLMKLTRELDALKLAFVSHETLHIANK